MSDDLRYSVEGAREAAERGQLGEWVTEFLASPGSDNAALADQLSASDRTWIGPVQLPLGRLHRLAGPSHQPVLCSTDDEEWPADVDEMKARIEQGWVPPPVIVTCRDEQLVLEDGNHRVESLRRAGVPETWAVVCFEDRTDLDRLAEFRESG